MWRNPVTGKLDLVLRSLDELTVKDHDLLDGLTDDDHTQYVLRNQWLQNGFVDASELDISWDDASRTLTLQPSGASFNYFLDGILYNETGSITEQITDTEGMWIFYIDAEGSISSMNSATEAQIASIIEDECAVAYVYWDATNNDGRLMIENHGYKMNPATHRYLHETIGSIFGSGMTLSDFVIDDNGDDDEDAQFSVASGKFVDQDLEHSLSAVAKTTGLEIWYRVGDNWRWTTNSGFSVLTAGSGRIAFNDSGAQTEASSGNFVLAHIFATNIVDDDGTSPRYIAVQGQNQYVNIVAARTGAENEINTLAYGTLPLEEMIPVATVIFQTGDGYSNAVKGRTRTTNAGDNYIDWRASGLRPRGGSITEHGSLTGLIDDDHTQYLLVDGTRAMTGDLLVDGGDIGITADPDLMGLASGALTVRGTLGLLNGTTINEFSIDGTLAGNSDDAVPTEKAVKTYVDGAGGVPVGAVIAVADDAVPTGYLECDSSAVSRTTYSDLFDKIGVMYGNGDGSTTFNLPDYRGKFLRGMDNGAGNDPDAAGRTDRGDSTTGDNVGTQQDHQLDEHRHLCDIGSNTGGYGYFLRAVTNQTPDKYTNYYGGNETRPININVIYCIKY
jgi:microcystin-dependent protein